MKRRRMTAIVLALALLLSLLPVSALAATQSTEDWCNASLDGKHTWSNWTIRKEATCTEKGERYRTCRNCRFEQTESIKKTGHDYGKWKVTREATCSKAGERVRKCKVCDHEDTQKIDKLPHTFGEWTVLKEATCTEKGSREHTCQVCGETVESSIDMLPHSWGGWETVVEATDHSAGTRRRVCQVCGTEETEDFEPEGTLHRGDRGDDVRQLQEGLICYGALKKGGADGVYGKGTERAVRQVQESEGLEPDGIAWPQTRGYAQHRFGEWQTITKLSRTTDGLRERTCERCGLVERDLVEARPLIKRGDRGKAVEAIQDIIHEIGYDPGRSDGVYGPRLDAAIVEWSRDHEWYYEPGLLKPADIDRIVGTWTKIEPDRTGISGPDTPVNLQISITRDFNMMHVMPGETLKYTYTVTNLGTEDCKLGPLFLSFGKDQNYKSDLTYYRYVGDLIGETLKANGANTYTGTFSFTADMDKAMLSDPVNDNYEIQVNAWVLGTSKVDKRRWYSNIDWALVGIYADENALDPKLELTGRVLGDREWYTLGEEFEFEATLTNNTGKDLEAYITGVGRTKEGSMAITPDEAAEPLPAGGTMTKTYHHVVGPEDEIKNGRYGFWLEANGFTEANEHVSAPSVSLWVEVRSPYQLGSDALVLTRESDDPEGAHYAAGENWPYRYRATNNGDVELNDVRIQAYIHQYGNWYPLNEREAGTLAVGAHEDLEGQRSVGGAHATQVFEREDENGKLIYAWGYEVDVIAQGVTPEGEVVYAKPIRDKVFIDFEDPNASGYRCLSISGKIVDPKDEYIEGDAVEVEVTLKNLSGMTLTNYTIRPLLGPDNMDDTYDDLGEVAGDAVIGAGESHTQTINLTFTRMWDTDGYHLTLEAVGETEDGTPVESNYDYMSVTVLPKDKNQDKHSLPIPSGLGGLLRNGPKPKIPVPQKPTPRSLTVVDMPKDDELYFDNAVIPVRMRLTIEDSDSYAFIDVNPALGDSFEPIEWAEETLEPGESYEFIYLMKLDPAKTGWRSRNVSVTLRSKSTGRREFESCEVFPPFANAAVIDDGVTERTANLYMLLLIHLFHGRPAAEEMLDIPFRVTCDGTADIRNIKLVYEQKQDKKTVNEGEVFLRDWAYAKSVFMDNRKIQIVGDPDAVEDMEYTLSMYVTGVYTDGKGKDATVKSEPIEIPLTVRPKAEGEKRLSLTCSVEPRKNAYAAGDSLTVTLRAENHTGVTLKDVVIDTVWPYHILQNELEISGSTDSIDDGHALVVVNGYIVSPADVEAGRIDMLFNAKATRQDTDEEVHSLNAGITLNYDDDPPQMLNLGVNLKDHREVYAPGSKVKVELEWRNGPLTSVRFYALGDNRAPLQDNNAEWHSFGHGASGSQFDEESNVAAIMGWHRREVTLQIPSDFEGSVYHAAWVIEGDADNYYGYTGVVRSNVATLDLPIGVAEYEGDESLSMALYTSNGYEPKAAIDEMVVLHAVLSYKGGALPDSYTVRFRPVGTEAWSVVNKDSNGSYNLDVGCALFPHADTLSGKGWTFEFEAFAADRPELAAAPVTKFIEWTGYPGDAGEEGPDGLPGDEPVPDWADDGEEGPDGLPGDEPVPDWADDGEEGPDGLPGDEPVPDWVDDGEEGPDGLPGDEPVPDWADDGEEGPDGLPGDEPVPDWVDDGEEGPDGLPGDEPVPDWAKAGEEEPEEPGASPDDIQLYINLLTACPDPKTGVWHDGDKVVFDVSAFYIGGPEVPVRMEVCVTDAVETAEPQKVLSVENSQYLVEPCEITLDASHAVSGKCVYDFVAYVYLNDEDHVDCYSETVPWVFDMAT